MDSVSRLAITFRIFDVGSSRNADAPTCVEGVNVLPAMDVAPPAKASSMSRLIMRPLGPEPLTFLKSMPLSAAIRAAIGETIMRPFVGAAAGLLCAFASAAEAPVSAGCVDFGAAPPADAGGTDCVDASPPLPPAAASFLAPPFEPT